MSPAQPLRILYLVHRVPFPPNRGDRIRSYNLLQFLAGKGQVYLAALADEPVSEETFARLRQLCQRVTIAPLSRALRWLNAAAALVGGRSATEGLFASSALRRSVLAWAREIKFDAVVVYCSSMASYAQATELEGARLLIDFVDVDSQKWLDYAATASFPGKQFYALEGRRVRNLERALVARADAVVLTSEHEADVLRAFAPTDRAKGIPNGVDLEYYTPSLGGHSSPQSLCVFVGVLDYRANVEGLRWFCSEVWPEVRRQLPEAVLKIVGRRPGPQVARLGQQPGVEVIGEVPDVRPYLRGAEMAIAPLQVARGIQNKVLEAMAMGRTVVATPQALEGIRLEPGTHARQARTAEDWVAAIAQLHADAPERERIGLAARDFVERHHCWEQCLAPWASLLGQLPAGGATGPIAEVDGNVTTEPMVTMRSRVAAHQD